MRRTLTLTLMAASLYVLGCGGSGDKLLSSNVEQVDQEARSGGNFLDATRFPTDQIVYVVPRDDIEALTDPFIVDPDSRFAWYLKDTDMVMGVAINGDVRAYPHNIGWWHEIVNDTVGGQPIVVSLCPLTGTGQVFNGRGRDGSRITLGVSGLLFNNNLVMYDRRDEETLYPQMTYTGVSGPGQGQQLEMLPVVETTWGYWKALYPNTKVLSGQTELSVTGGIYQRYPYMTGTIDYRLEHNIIDFPLSPELHLNPTAQRFQSKEMTFGVRFGDIAKAYPWSNLGDRAVINDTVAGNPIVVIWYAEANLALAYSRTFDGKELTFDMVESKSPVYPFLLKDREGGTTWNLKGEGIEGGYRGFRLIPVPGHNAFWFAWATFWQNTGIY